MTIKKQWGLRTAKQWLEQEFSKGLYLNDSATASYFPYCWANDLTRLAKEGLFFLKNYNNQGPKHLTTYFDDVIEFVSFLSNRQSGAVGLPNVLIWAYYFWKKDVEDGYFMKDPEYYLRQQCQKLSKLAYTLFPVIAGVASAANEETPLCFGRKGNLVGGLI